MKEKMQEIELQNKKGNVVRTIRTGGYIPKEGDILWTNSSQTNPQYLRVYGVVLEVDSYNYLKVIVIVE